MSKTLIEIIEEAMQRPVPYEGLLGREFSPFGHRRANSKDSGAREIEVLMIERMRSRIEEQQTITGVQE